MAQIPPETRVIYEMMRADFDLALNKSLRDHTDSTTQAILKLDAKLEQLSGRIDEVKLSIGVDLDELRSGLDCASAPVDSGKGTSTTSPSASGGVSSGSEGFRSDNKHKSLGQRLYVPPPARGMQIDLPSPRVPLSSIENLHQSSSDVFGSGPRIELPQFDGSYPKLWSLGVNIIPGYRVHLHLCGFHMLPLCPQGMPLVGSNQFTGVCHRLVGKNFVACISLVLVAICIKRFCINFQTSAKLVQ
ncbi:hypothetical protein VPH35_078691 [Triticum aestivum]